MKAIDTEEVVLTDVDSWEAGQKFANNLAGTVDSRLSVRKIEGQWKVCIYIVENDD